MRPYGGDSDDDSNWELVGDLLALGTDSDEASVCKLEGHLLVALSNGEPSPSELRKPQCRKSLSQEIGYARRDRT